MLQGNPNLLILPFKIFVHQIEQRLAIEHPPMRLSGADTLNHSDIHM